VMLRSPISVMPIRALAQTSRLLNRGPARKHSAL
jgi:hypothetical protein